MGNNKSEGRTAFAEPHDDVATEAELRKTIRKLRRDLESALRNASISEEIAESSKSLLLRTQEALEAENKERARTAAALREAKTKADLASVAKSHFLATMSHELRTPMHGVLGLLELLLAGDLEPPQRDLTLLAHSSAKALIGLVSEVLDFSKIEAGKMVLQESSFSLRSLIEEVVALQSGLAEIKGLSLSGLVAHDVPDVLIGDPGRLRQVLLNLLANAVKYTYEGTVTLEVDLEGHGDASGEQYLRCDVTDTGIGIEPAQFQKLFQPFSQFESSPSRRFQGTGLGLAIVSNLLSLMGGSISVESVPREGSTFSAQFPLRVDHAAIWEEAPVGEQSGLSVVHILTAERDPLVLHKIQVILEKSGCRVSCASSEEELLEHLRQHGEQYDLVLADSKLLSASVRQLAQGRKVIPLVDTEEQGTIGEDPSGASLTRPVRGDRLLEIVLESLGVSDAEGVRERVEPSFTTPVRISDEMRTLRALVVDDNEANLVVARLMLERCGCQVETVTGGEQALQRLQEVGFDFVLMDCSMPGIDGYETTRRIRTLKLPEERQPFIAGVTAFVLPGEKERCLSSGMDSYLPKPVSLKSMHGLVVRTLKRA